MYVKTLLPLLVLLFSLVGGILFEKWVRKDPEERLRHIAGFSFGIGLTALVIGIYIGEIL